jgi:MipA family protein
MQAYFGVTPAQASGCRTYTPKAGVRRFKASFGAEYACAKDWKIQGALVLSKLAGDAEDSPLVARKASTPVTAGVTYTFRGSHGADGVSSWNADPTILALTGDRSP